MMQRALMVVLAMGVTACGGSGAGTSAGTSGRPPTEAPPPVTTPVVVYLMRGEQVAPVQRSVTGTGSPASLALAGLLQPLSVRERASGLVTQIPVATRSLGAKVDGNLATVNMSGDFESGGGSLSMRARVAQVVYTMTRIPGVTRVAFQLDGRPVTSIGGEGVLVAPPVTRATFEDLAPAILIESPLPQTIVTSPLHVSGTANVFEAQFVLEVADWDGRIIARESVHATSGTGSRGSFDAMIAFTAPTGPKRITLIAYEPSAKDGSPTHEVEIPLRLGG